MLPLAVLTTNTVPRPSLQGKTPFYLMMGRDSHTNMVGLEEFFDLTKYTQTLVKNRKFAVLLRELILHERNEKKRKISQKYKDIPEGTLVYEKDFTATAQKKMKTVFKPAPLKCVKQYRCTVFCKDIYGRVRKLSKNNIKLMGPRSQELFGKLPQNVQMALGEPMDQEIWDKIEKGNDLPGYLKFFQLDMTNPVTKNGPIEKGTHVVEQDDVPFGDLQDDEDDIDAILEAESVEFLKALYDSDQIHEEWTVPKIKSEMKNRTFEPIFVEEEEDEEAEGFVPSYFWDSEKPFVPTVRPLPKPIPILKAAPGYRDWETDRKSTRLNSSHRL